jgi:3-methyl-2-oxobutanoate hydroxymethyltransferase
VAALVTKELRIPTIGIGAGPHCDGQVLVGPDLLGITPGFSPKFLKRFAEIDGQIRSAAADYVNEVHRGTFPGPEHTHS